MIISASEGEPVIVRGTEEEVIRRHIHMMEDENPYLNGDLPVTNDIENDIEFDEFGGWIKEAIKKEEEKRKINWRKRIEGTK